MYAADGAELFDVIVHQSKPISDGEGSLSVEVGLNLFTFGDRVGTSGGS